MNMENNYETVQPVEFAQNGKFIPIDQQSAINYIFFVLNDFDEKNIKGNITPKEPNPYQDKLVMPTNNGKFIVIPEDLHKFAIEKWIEQKRSINLNKISDNSVIDDNYGVKASDQKEEESDDEDDIILHSGGCECKKCKKCSKNKNSKDHTYYVYNSYYFKLFVCIMILIILAYVAKSFYE